VRRTATALALAATLALATAPFAHGQTATPSKPKVVLRVGTTIDLTTDNPWAVNAGSDYSVATVEYDMLLKFSDDDLTPAPSLATACTPSSDSMTWTCTLRDGLKWSDGAPLTSKDIAFTYRFVIDNDIPQYREYFPFHPTFETPDDHTLIWKAEEPTFAPDMPPWVYIVPQHVWQPYDGQGLGVIKRVNNTPAIGSGPFILTSWTHRQGWTMKRNPYYWGPAPQVDEVDYRLYTNQEAMIQALKNGEIDMIDGLKPSLSSALKGDSHITVQQVVSDWWLNLAFNFGGRGTGQPLPALRDLRVRKAIEMAIDKQTIAQKVYLGTATPGDTVVRPASNFWHLDIPTDQEIPFDPPGANQLLDDAGYVDTNGDGIREDPNTHEPLKITMPASSDTTGAVEAGQLIVGYLKAIGIQVDLRAVNDSKMDDYWTSGNFDAYIWYWSGDPDPNYQLSVFTSQQCNGWSDGCWQDPNYDALYKEQRGIMNRDARLKVVQEAQRYLYDHIPCIVLVYPGWTQAYRNDLFTDWTPTPGAQGYLLPGYNYDSLLTIRTVGTGTNAPSSSVPGWIWLVAVAAVVIVGVLLFRRGRRRELEEG
jgi:peptide/nickel transport system substrate-binding protein